MPFAPNTTAVLQAIQYRVQQEVLVNSASPFTAFSTAANTGNPSGVSDATRYGTNPNGTITNAIFIGVPKDWPSLRLYPRMCHVIPPPMRDVERHALGGKVWDWSQVYIRFIFQRKDDWYQNQLDLIAAADVMYGVLTRHAELPGASTVQATTPMKSGQLPAYHHEEMVGEEYDCWGFLWRVKQEWTVSGGIVQ